MKSRRRSTANTSANRGETRGEVAQIDPLRVLADSRGVAPTQIDRLFLDERELARLITLSTRTLYMMRKNGSGPPFARLGGRVVYRWSDVDRWISERTRTKDGERGAVGSGS